VPATNQNSDRARWSLPPYGRIGAPINLWKTPKAFREYVSVLALGILGIADFLHLADRVPVS
jgi:hypothetical protein